MTELDIITEGYANLGGPAFPSEETSRSEGMKFHHRGMMLRDYFAGQAVAGVLATDIDFESADLNNMAAYAYAVADAMLRHREKDMTVTLKE